MDKETFTLHLGDFDPSGVSIFESVAEDVKAFVMQDRRTGFVDLAFERVALTREQVQTYDLPTAPPKATDSRRKTLTGGTCQLEALPPNVIADIPRAAIETRIDWIQFNADLMAQDVDRLMTRGLLPAP